MWNDIRASWALLIGVGFMMLGNGLQGTLLGLRAVMEGFPIFTTGIIMSGYFLGILTGSMLAPRLVQRVGHIRVFAALASLASISILIHALFVDTITWTLMRFLTGLSYAGLYVVAESWLNDRASNENRGQVLSVYMVISTVGLGAGQFLLNLSSPMQVDLFVLTSIIVSFGLIPILLTARPAPSFASTGTLSLKELYKASPLAVISNALTGMAHGTLFGLGAVYARQQIYNVDLISWFMASFLLGSLIFQWPIGFISDRFGRRLAMAIISVVAMLACFVCIVIPRSSFLFFIATTIVGGAAIPMYSLCIAYANDRLEPDQIVAASGSLVMVSGFGLTCGPIIVAYLMGEFGPHFYFIGIGTAFTLIFGFTLHRMRQREDVSIDDQVPIVAAGQIGTPVAEYIAPDAEEYVEAVISGELDKLDENEESNKSTRSSSK